MDIRRFFTQQLNFRFVNEPLDTAIFEGISVQPSDVRVLFEGKGVRVLRLTIQPLIGDVEKPCIRVLRKHYPDSIYLFADRPADIPATSYHLCNDAGKQLPLTPEKQRLFTEKAHIFEVTSDVTGTIDLLERIEKAFESEKITKKFYIEFKKYRKLLFESLPEVMGVEDRNWYASVMLNRLMFIYFIQKHGFIAGQDDWLRDRLTLVEKQNISFYTDFLLPLFFNAFAQPKGARGKHEKTFTDVPYLNGGLFQRHEIEDRYPAITIDNKVFRELLDYLQTWRWYLDERPLHNEREINPDVLGYIFEQYVNQKQMGAYYTQEDITGYNCKYTILPFVLDKQARILGLNVDQGAPLPLPITADNIERYVYEAVKTGAHLPTETEREYAARAKRYAQIRDDAASTPGVAHVNDLITYNLDILTYADDAIAQMTERELFVFYFECLQKATVLDPTCGSGAFLFAALNILLPLYQACINRIRHFATQRPRAGIATEHAQFQAELKRIAQHDNERYYTVKSIIVNNLYGVDIMEEATEICKLRLFLRLAAEIKDAANIEPLPDIDFNIKAGNTLVGFATRDQVKEALSTSLHGNAVQGKFLTGGETLAGDAIAEVERKCKEVDRQYQGFHRMQIRYGYKASELADAKAQLRAELRSLNDELNRALAREYGITLPVEKGEARTTAGRKGKAPLNTLAENAVYQEWLHSHQPFHWFAEFYGILAGGGFDVIVGNPPFVEYSKVRDKYEIQSYATEECGNLFAFVIERSMKLLCIDGRFGMIIPLSSFCTQRMSSLWRTIRSNRSSNWISHFGWRPSKLFDGVNLRLSIVLSGTGSLSAGSLNTTTYNKWNSDFRQFLLSVLSYIAVPELWTKSGYIPKIGSAMEADLLLKMALCHRTMLALEGNACLPVYYKNTGVNHWITATKYPPKAFRGTQSSQSSRQTEFNVQNEKARDFVICCMNSSLFLWYYIVRTNCRDLNPSDIRTFPIPESIEKDPHFASLANELIDSLETHSRYIVRQQKLTGEIRLQSFIPHYSKPIIDEIDRVLAQHYGFTDEELDFIINYDLKYRMGKDAAGDADEE